MTHNEQNVSDYHQGDALELHVSVVDNDGNIVGLVDASAEWLLKKLETDPDTDALLTKSTSNTGEITITDPDMGELTVKIDTGDITDAMVGNLHHRLRITDANGDRATVFTGDFEVLE